MSVATQTNPIATLSSKIDGQCKPRVLTDASGIVFLVPESLRSKIVHTVTRLTQHSQPHIDARGGRTIISTRFAFHLSEQRRSHLWSVLARIAGDMQSAAKERTKHVRVSLISISCVCYGALFVPATLTLPAVISALLAVLGMLCVVGAMVAHKLIDPPWRERRRIILAHRRCPCCLASIDAPSQTSSATNQSTHTIDCPTCANAWLISEIPPLAQTRTRCGACGYDTCTSRDCPECGLITDALRRAG